MDSVGWQDTDDVQVHDRAKGGISLVKEADAAYAWVEDQAADLTGQFSSSSGLPPQYITWRDNDRQIRFTAYCRRGL